MKGLKLEDESIIDFYEFNGDIDEVTDDGMFVADNHDLELEYCEPFIISPQKRKQTLYKGNVVVINSDGVKTKISRKVFDKKYVIL